MRRFLLLFPLACLLAAAWAGCAGYVIGPVKPKRWADVKTISIATFKNDTLEPRIEVLLADSLIKQFQQDGTFEITDEAHADAILDVKIESIDRRGARSVNNDVLLAREYTLSLRGHYEFKRRTTGEMLDTRTVAGTTSYFVSGSSEIQADVIQDERQAIPNAAQDLAVHLVSQISEGW